MNLILKQLKDNLSPRFIQTFQIENQMRNETEDTIVSFLTSLASFTVHPPSGNDEWIKEQFIDDASFICELGIQLTIDKKSKVSLHSLLAEILLEKGKLIEAISNVNLAKALLITDEIENCKYLEELLILEWHANKQLGRGLRMHTLEEEITKYKEIYDNNIIKDKTMEDLKEDLIACIKQFGVEKTFNALKIISNESNKLLKARGQLASPIEKFEFNLFAFSFYLIYLAKKKDEEIYNSFKAHGIAHFTKASEQVARFDPIQNDLFSLLVTDKEKYVEEKLKEYENDILNLLSNPEYTAKYTFASFYIEPFLKARSIKRDSSNLIDKNIIDFKVELDGVISMLNSTSLHLKEYVNF